MKQIKITCEGNDTLKLSEIKGLQGNLKELPSSNFEKLKKSLIKHGFAFPVNLARLKGKPYGIIDAHQRVKVLSALLNEGYTLLDINGNETDAIPVTYTDVKSKNGAGQLILQAVSQYGKVSEDGLIEFMNDYEINNINDYDIEGFTKESEGSLKKNLDFETPEYDIKFPIMILQSELEYKEFEKMKENHKVKSDEKMFTIIFDKYRELC